MKHFHYRYETCIQFTFPISDHFFKLRCRPDSFATQQLVNERLLIDPHERWIEGRDAFGNLFVQGSILKPHDQFHCVSEGTVGQTAAYYVADGVDRMYRYASPLTGLSDELIRFLQTMDVAGLTSWDRAVRLSEAVHQEIVYTPGATQVDTPAADAFHLRQGVCQDYAQILIACCRHVGIPARYVCGLLLGEGQTHAWVEVHDGKVWRGLDPTNNQQIEYGYIKIAHGRDATDCPVNRGVFRGLAAQQTEVHVVVTAI
ncbi:MAG: transglutaminase domain-containing protein [Parabacteroides sp.]